MFRVVRAATEAALLTALDVVRDPMSIVRTPLAAPASLIYRTVALTVERDLLLALDELLNGDNNVRLRL